MSLPMMMLFLMLCGGSAATIIVLAMRCARLEEALRQERKIVDLLSSAVANSIEASIPDSRIEDEIIRTIRKPLPGGGKEN